jgi:MinD superfamily P-loop ATPase
MANGQTGQWTNEKMKELIVISGKGGTGKTSIMGAFATLAENKVLCDADVDAADLHLLTDPSVQQRHDFKSGHTASISKEGCTACGMCRELCKWDAIDDDFVIDPIACEGCGVCVYFCPEETIEFPINTCGEWYISTTRFGSMVHARLGIAEENSGKLVSLVRSEARKLAEQKEADLILTDGPPGVGCPVIASIGGADAVLVVTEPSVSGIHDLKRVCQLAEHFKIPAMVCINKFDLNVALTKEIENYTQRAGIECLGRVPFDPAFTHAMVQAKTIFEYDAYSASGDSIKGIWEKILKKLEVVSSIASLKDDVSPEPCTSRRLS